MSNRGGEQEEDVLTSDMVMCDGEALPLVHAQGDVWEGEGILIGWRWKGRRNHISFLILNTKLKYLLIWIFFKKKLFGVFVF